MPEREVMKFQVDHAELIYRNFEGKEAPMNRKGDRNFCVILDEDTAQQMLQDEWNVKYTNPKEDGDIPRPYIQVTVRFDVRPPRIVLISSTGRTAVTEDTVSSLDSFDFANVDLIARSYYWNFNGKEGYKAYLQTMFATIEEDELERRYAVAFEEDE